MIEYDCIHHVSLTVTDLESAKKFYGEILGLREIERPNFDFPGAWYQIGLQQQLHLIVHPGSQTLRKEGGIHTRDGHFALRVKDYKKAAEWLQKAGVEIVKKAGQPKRICANLLL